MAAHAFPACGRFAIGVFTGILLSIPVVRGARKSKVGECLPALGRGTNGEPRDFIEESCDAPPPDELF